MEEEGVTVELGQKSKPPVPIKRNRQFVRKALKFDRLEKNYWSTQYYYLFCILLGNGVYGMPLAFRFAMDISGAFFISLLIVFSFVVTVPIIYMEIFLGRYTGMTNGQMYRMVPLFFGYCTLIFIINAFHSPAIANQISSFFITAMQFAINEKYLTECPADAVGCYKSPLELQDKKCELIYDGLNCSGQTYKYVSQYLHMFKSENEINLNTYAVWLNLVSNIITWFATIGFCIAGIRIIGIVLKISFTLNLVFYLTIFFMGIASNGGSKALVNLIQFDLESFQISEVIMIIFFNMMKLGVAHPTGYMTYSAFADRNRKTGPASEAVLLTLLNIVLTIFYLAVFHVVAGNLAATFGLTLKSVFVPFSGVYSAMISEFLHRLDIPVFFIVAFHLANWFLEVSKMSGIMFMHALNLFDFFPGICKYQTYVFLGSGMFALLLNIIGTILKLREVLTPILLLCEMQFLRGFKLLGESVMVFYCYGVSRLNDDIHFYTGKRPIKYWRILWYIYPALMVMGMGIISIDKFPQDNNKLNLYKDFNNISPRNILFISFILMVIYLLLIFLGIFFYIIIGVRSISSITNVLKPQFYWGPQNKQSRITRKCFAPRTTIRSQPPKKKKIRFRPNSIKLFHERDAAKHEAQGRIFLDSIFYTNVGIDPKGFKLRVGMNLSSKAI